MAEKPVAAHIVNQFLPTGVDYVHKQIIGMDEFAPVVLSPYRIDGRHPVPAGRFMIESGLYFRFVTKFFPAAYDIMAARFLEREIGALQPAVIHCHFGMAAPHLIRLKKAFPEIPAVITFYGRDASELILQEKWRRIYREMITAADRLIVLCDEVRERFVRLGCPNRKIAVWDIGIDIQKYDYVSRREKKSVVFLIAARFVEKKGYFVLLDAFKELSEKNGAVRLAIMGFGGLKDEIIKRINEYGLNEKIELTDTSGISDFERLFLEKLKKSDIFILPSRASSRGDDEGGPPVVITNAAATGLPVISTGIAGISRAVIDGKTGILVRENSANELLAAMERLAGDFELRRSFGKEGSRHMRVHFSIDKQMKKLQGIYKALRK